MLQPYNCIRLSISVAIRLKIKSLIRSRTITKCFSFYKKRIYDFTNMFCVKILFSILWLQVFDLFWFKRMVETCTFTDFFTFLRKCIHANYFLTKFGNATQIFPWMLVINAYYSYFYFLKGTLMQIWKCVDHFAYT